MSTILFPLLQIPPTTVLPGRPAGFGSRRRIGPGAWVAGLLMAGMVFGQEVTPPVPPPAGQPAPPAGATTPTTPPVPADGTVPTTTDPGGTPADPAATNTLLPDIPPGGILPFGVKDLERRKSIPYKEPSKGELSSEIERALDEVSTRRISLMEAVRIALLNDPVIQIAGEEVAIAEAARMIARATFDPRLAAGVSYERRRAELSEAEIARNQEQFDRNKALVKATGEERRKLERELKQLENGETPESATVEGQLQNELEAEALEILEELAAAAGVDTSQLAKIEESIAKQGIQVRRDVIETLALTERNAIKQNEQFPVNSVRLTETTTFDLSVIKQFRNGIILKPYFEYDNAQTNLQRRGGVDRVNLSEIGIDLTLPLGRGRGTIAASGHEMAAQIDVEASQLSLQHTVAERVLGVVLAYWNLAAAQEQLAYLIRSEVTSIALAALNDNLIKADEVPAASASQSLARRSQAMASRMQGEITLEQAQQNLALLMGVGGEDIIYAPLASDPLPAITPERSVKALSVPELAQRAFAQRADYRSARKVVDSGKLLAEQARLNIKPRVDLNLGLFYTGRDEDGSRESYYHFAFENHAGPGFMASLRMDWPFFLHDARGNYVRQRADLEIRRDQMRLINNQIVSGITQSHFTLRLTARQLGMQEEAVSQFERALATEREGFRLGLSTMIDTIQTEERLTEARSQLVFTRLQNAQSLSRLRFETGTLMPHDEAGHTSVSRSNFVTLPVFGPEPVDDVIAPRSRMKNLTRSLFGETDPHRVLRKLDAKEQRAAEEAAANQPPPAARTGK